MTRAYPRHWDEWIDHLAHVLHLPPPIRHLICDWFDRRIGYDLIDDPHRDSGGS